MVKTTNENKVQYVAPKMKVFQVRPELNVMSNFGVVPDADVEGEENY